MSHARGPNRGWLCSHGAGGPWSGVLLHRDAFLVYADSTVLRDPPGDLVVQVGEAATPIDEILLIDEPVPQDLSTAMIRLTRPVEGAPSVVIDRAAVTGSWNNRQPLWSTLQGLGVVPDGAGEPSGTTVSGPERPAAVPVKSVTAGPADWCTIFWWLC